MTASGQDGGPGRGPGEQRRARERGTRQPRIVVHALHGETHRGCFHHVAGDAGAQVGIAHGNVVNPRGPVHLSLIMNWTMSCSGGSGACAGQITVVPSGDLKVTSPPGATAACAASRASGSSSRPRSGRPLDARRHTTVWLYRMQIALDHDRLFGALAVDPLL